MGRVDDVRVEIAAAHNLAAVSRTSSRERLSSDIIAGFDLIWPELRHQGVATGRNVVVYHGGPELIDVGVEVPNGFAEAGGLKAAQTPAGEVVRAAHFGAYSELGAAYERLEAWRREAKREFAGVSWEIYGHWTDDPSALRTDVYFLLRHQGA
jgi:hypothetical protein